MIDNNRKEKIDYFKSLNWIFQIWKPTPALIDKNGFATHQYIGQNFDKNYFTIDTNGWTHDHCEICSNTLCENREECEVSGYVSNNQWLCVTCYNSLIKESQ